MGRAGGGVAFFLCEQLDAKVLRHSDDDTNRKPEYLIAEITTNFCSKILLAVVYRPPHYGFLAEFFNVYAELLTLYKHSITLGDFNADLCS